MEERLVLGLMLLLLLSLMVMELENMTEVGLIYHPVDREGCGGGGGPEELLFIVGHGYSNSN